MVKKLVFGSIIWITLALMYLPMIIIVIFSFSETTGMSFRNFNFGFGLYSQLFQNQAVMTAVLNTLVIGIVAAFLATILGTIACVGIMAMRKRSRNATMMLNLTPVINADIVISFSLVLFFVSIGIFSSGVFKLILAHTLICLPIVVLLMLPRMRSLDSNLFEAAQDLGAKPVQALTTVIIPQLMPVMISAFLLGFTLSINDFIITVYNNEGITTISTIVYGATRTGNPPELRALTSLVFALVLVILVVINFRIGKIVRSRKSRK